MTVMDLDKNLHRIEQSEIPRINEDIKKGYKELEELHELKQKILELNLIQQY